MAKRYSASTSWRRAGRHRDTGIDPDAFFLRNQDLTGAARQMDIGQLAGHAAAAAARGGSTLEEANLGTAASLRQRLEQHRASPACAACHDQMDPLGFSLENYDAAGRWRTRDGNFDVDSVRDAGGRKNDSGAEGLKHILRSQAGLFARNVTEKMLTFALGRGLGIHDRPAVERDPRQAAAGRLQVFDAGFGIVKAALSRAERERMSG